MSKVFKPNTADHPNGFNIIGDIAGNYQTLQNLLKQMPKGATPVSVGDMVDRGPRNKEVLQFFRKHGLAVMGNHEDLMLDYFDLDDIKKYEEGVWLYNGGRTTLKEFGPRDNLNVGESDLLAWVSRLPLCIELDGAVVTHAPIRGDFTLSMCLEIESGFTKESVSRWMQTKGNKNPRMGDSVLWNRGTPRRKHKEDLGLQIHGHNSYGHIRRFADHGGVYSICLDSSRGDSLSGIHWPSGEEFTEPYVKGEGTNV